MMIHRSSLRPALFTVFALCLVMAGRAASAHAQSTDQTTGSDVKRVPVSPDVPDPTKRERTDQEKIQANKAMKHELKGSYKTWVEQDVRWIITDEELAAFKNLSNDEERDQFIENFWLRRNPDPDSPENEYREEHYARIAYANEHFAAGKAGWRTDRGHIYIAYGKPDSIDSHPSGGSYERPMEEGGGNTSTFPFEVWHYRYIEGIGDNIDIEFVDTCMCGDYHMTIDRSEKDALKHVPGAGLTMDEEMGRSNKADRFSGGGLEQLGKGPNSSSNQSKQFDRLDTFAKLQAAPVIKFKDLESYMVSSKILTGPPFLFNVRTDYVKVTNDTVLVPMTLQMNTGDITFNTKDGVSTGTVNILGRVSSLTGRPLQTFEDTVEVQVPSELLSKERQKPRVSWKAFPLVPGRYKFDVVIKDVNNPDHVGHWQRGVVVPKFDDDQLGHSSLILADNMYRVPSKDIGAGNFVISNTHITPRVPTGVAVPVIFHHNQNLNFWMQVYNLGIGDNKQNGATIEYQIMNLATNKPVLDTSENSNKIKPNADQVTLEKSLPLASLPPGNYAVNIKVNDGVKKQQFSESAPFTVD
jgi:GWxTD domain-containing protein